MNDTEKGILMFGSKEERQSLGYKETWVENDGGRSAAGFKGSTGDCACRAVAIATGLPYREVYDLLNEFAKKERTGSRKKKISNARTGYYSATLRKVMASLGWDWVSTMQIGSGCKVHLNSDELPSGTIITRLSKHYCTVINGVIQDTYDPSREGTRCVYGYWKKEQPDVQ